MKRILLCGYDDGMKELGDLTSPLMQAYASRHGYDFKCVRNYPKTYMPYWHKLHLVKQELYWYEEVHWMDSDILITNPDFCLPEFHNYGLTVSRDWGVDAISDAHFSSCHFVARGQEAEDIFENAIELEKQWDAAKLYDQDALRLVADPLNVRVMPRRYFNAVPIEVHESTPEPWQPGDFCAHLTMLPMAGRIELFHKIREMTK